MNRAWKHRDVLVLSLLAVAGFIALVYWLLPQPPAQYQGRNAYEWAARLEWPPERKSREEAVTALLAMGKDALPLLQQRLTEKEPVFRQARRWLGNHLPGELGTAVLRSLDPINHVPIRCAAAQGLKTLGTNAAPAVPALIQAVRGTDHQVRWHAASALGEVGPAAVLPLIRLLDDPDVNVRHAAAFALGQIGPPALPAVLKLVERLGDRSEPVRNSAFYSLSRIGAVAGPTVLNLVQNRTDGERWLAVEALAAVRPRGQLTLPILTVLASDLDSTNRCLVIDTMRALNLTHTNAVRVYLAGLADTNAAVRLASAKAIESAAHKSSGALGTLSALTQEDPDPEVRTAAAIALEKIAALKQQ